MDYERFNKARLTVQVCSFPNKINTSQNQQALQKQRTSLTFLPNSFEKKLNHLNEEHNQMAKIGKLLSKQRNSQDQYTCRQRFSSNLLSFPEIRMKTTRDEQKKCKIEELKAYSSAKLSFGPYHKIQPLLASKYNLKMEMFNKKQIPSKKTFIISEINGAQLQKIKQQRKNFKQQARIKVKSMKKAKKNHLNRIKNQIDIPLQLLSQKCQEGEIDLKTHGLQMKNILRFEFDNNMQSMKLKQKLAKRKRQEGKLQGWKFQHKHSIPSFHFQY